VADAVSDIFKRKIVKEYADCLQFDEIDALYEEAKNEAKGKAVEKGKEAKQDEAIQSQLSEPAGGGGDMSGGGDMGSGDGGFGDDGSGGGDMGSGGDIGGGLPSI
jgi:hypothetical protein